MMDLAIGRNEVHLQIGDVITIDTEDLSTVKITLTRGEKRIIPTKEQLTRIRDFFKNNAKRKKMSTFVRKIKIFRRKLEYLSSTKIINAGYEEAYFDTKRCTLIVKKVLH